MNKTYTKEQILHYLKIAEGLLIGSVARNSEMIGGRYIGLCALFTSLFNLDFVTGIVSDIIPEFTYENAVIHSSGTFPKRIAYKEFSVSPMFWWPTTKQEGRLEFVQWLITQYE